MQKNDLINVDTDYTFCSITDKGIEIFENGGWLKHIELEKQKEKIESDRQQMSDQKLKYDVKNARRIFKTYWWTFGVSIAAFIISVMLGIIKLLEVFNCL